MWRRVYGEHEFTLYGNDKPWFNRKIKHKLAERNRSLISVSREEFKRAKCELQTATILRGVSTWRTFLYIFIVSREPGTPKRHSTIEISRYSWQTSHCNLTTKMWVVVHRWSTVGFCTCFELLARLGTYARILVIDFSSAFNTSIPFKLFNKLSLFNVHLVALTSSHALIYQSRPW